MKKNRDTKRLDKVCFVVCLVAGYTQYTLTVGFFLQINYKVEALSFLFKP